jgi:aspartyl-tRNA(Asn)/glutamyl-tRNA(Gln) amidotransferase subunit A
MAKKIEVGVAMEINLDTLTLSDASEAIRARRLTSTKLTEAFLERIERYNPFYNCYITVSSNEALAQAHAADALLAEGTWLGPLHGIPISVKDTIATKDIRTTIGSPAYKDWIPDVSAPVVEHLLNAGAVILGKNTTHEFSAGQANPLFGEPKNPWLPGRSCLMSSHGSAAAVACGLALASVGTDTGGSVRLPSAAVGVSGFKPSLAIVSRMGCYPRSDTLDMVGFMTHTVREIAWMTSVVSRDDGIDLQMRGVRPQDFTAQFGLKLQGIRIGHRAFDDETSPLEAEVREHYREALEEFARAGAELVEVRTPDDAEVRTACLVITLGEWAEAHRDLLQNKLAELSPAVQRLMLTGAAMPAAEYVHAQRVRQSYVARYEEIFRKIDVMAVTTLAMLPYEQGAQQITVDGITESPLFMALRHTVPQNMTGQPSVSVPMRFSKEGLPTALMLTGRRYEDAFVLAVADAYQQITDWHSKRPVLRAPTAS